MSEVAVGTQLESVVVDLVVAMAVRKRQTMML